MVIVKASFAFQEMARISFNSLSGGPKNGSVVATYIAIDGSPRNHQTNA